MKKSILYLAILMVFIACSKSEVEDIGAIKVNNLEEYLEVNSSLITKEMFAFGISNTSVINESFAPEAGAVINFHNNRRFYNVLSTIKEVLYFETDNVNVDENDFTQYNRRVLEFGYTFGFLSSIIRPTDTKEVWAIVTYKDNGLLYRSKPIKIQPKNKPIITRSNDPLISVDLSNKFKPKFSWKDGVNNDSEIFVQSITEDSLFEVLTTTLTKDKWFQYSNLENIISNFSKEIGWLNLKSNKKYYIHVYGIDKDNWGNMSSLYGFKIP